MVRSTYILMVNDNIVSAGPAKIIFDLAQGKVKEGGSKVEVGRTYETVYGLKTLNRNMIQKVSMYELRCEFN